MDLRTNSGNDLVRVKSSVSTEYNLKRECSALLWIFQLCMPLYILPRGGSPVMQAFPPPACHSSRIPPGGAAFRGRGRGKGR